MITLTLNFPEPVDAAFVRTFCNLLGSTADDIALFNSTQTTRKWTVCFRNHEVAECVKQYVRERPQFFSDVDDVEPPANPEDDLVHAVRDLCGELKYDRLSRQQESERLKHMHRELVNTLRRHNGNQLISDLCDVVWHHMVADEQDDSSE